MNSIACVRKLLPNPIKKKSKITQQQKELQNFNANILSGKQEFKPVFKSVWRKYSEKPLKVTLPKLSNAAVPLPKYNYFSRLKRNFLEHDDQSYMIPWIGDEKCAKFDNTLKEIMELDIDKHGDIVFSDFFDKILMFLFDLQDIKGDRCFSDSELVCKFKDIYYTLCYNPDNELVKKIDYKMLSRRRTAIWVNQNPAEHFSIANELANISELSCRFCPRFNCKIHVLPDGYNPPKDFLKKFLKNNNDHDDDNNNNNNNNSSNNNNNNNSRSNSNSSNSNSKHMNDEKGKIIRKNISSDNGSANIGSQFSAFPAVPKTLKTISDQIDCFSEPYRPCDLNCFSLLLKNLFSIDREMESVSIPIESLVMMDQLLQVFGVQPCKIAKILKNTCAVDCRSIFLYLVRTRSATKYFNDNVVSRHSGAQGPIATSAQIHLKKIKDEIDREFLFP